MKKLRFEGHITVESDETAELERRIAELEAELADCRGQDDPPAPTPDPPGPEPTFPRRLGFIDPPPDAPLGVHPVYAEWHVDDKREFEGLRFVVHKLSREGGQLVRRPAYLLVNPHTLKIEHHNPVDVRADALGLPSSIGRTKSGQLFSLSHRSTGDRRKTCDILLSPTPVGWWDQVGEIFRDEPTFAEVSGNLGWIPEEGVHRVLVRPERVWLEYPPPARVIEVVDLSEDLSDYWPKKLNPGSPALAPDAGDAPGDEFYGLVPWRHGSLVAGILTVYHVGQDHTVDSQLVVSRDLGKTWERALGRKSIIPRGAPGEPDAGQIYAGPPVVAPDGTTYIPALVLEPPHVDQGAGSIYTAERPGRIGLYTLPPGAVLPGLEDTR